MKKVNIKTTLFVSAIIFLALWLGLSNCNMNGEPEPCEPDSVYFEKEISTEVQFISELNNNGMSPVISIFNKSDSIIFRVNFPLWNLKTLADKYYPCKPVHDTTAVHDTLYLPEPQPVFNQISARTSYKLSWHAAKDSTMGIFLIYNVPGINLPGYLIKEVAYPESTCILQNTLLNFDSQDYLLTKIYMQAKDNAGNLSGPSDSVKAVFAKNPGIWGDVFGNSEFDSKDLSVMEYYRKKEYNPAFDFYPDGKIDSLDFKAVEGK